jgi:DNA repair protein SbcC/Rad50
MKPVILEMHAFGPYARSQVIDFRELGDRPLFLIHGPTGAGKSSILDAICVALFGETSGDERTGGQMRSDHAAPDQQTRVVFSFSIGSMIYTIDRTPKQFVPRRDGSGLREIQQKVSMFEQSGEDDDPRLIASRVHDVGDQVQRLIGLRADQFRQVVVLPQGRFRELLTANSNEREKIFSTLFQTYHYRAIQDRLKDHAREIRKELDQLSEREHLVLESNDVSSSDELTKTIETLDLKITRLQEQHTEQQAVVARARTDLESARDADKKLKEVQAARTELGELKERLEEIEAKRTSLARAQRAGKLVEPEKYLNARMEEAKASEEARDKIAQALETADEALQTAELEKQEADTLQPQLDSLIGKQGELERLRPRIVALDEAEGAAREAREAAQKRSEEHEQLLAQEAEVNESLERDQKKLHAARLQAGQVGGLDATRNQLSRLVRQRDDLEKEREKLRQEMEAQDKAETGLETAESNLRDTQQILERMEQAWRGGQAAVLARQLQDEHPCPVCGSTHHPSPATSEQEIPDDSDLETQRQAVETARHNLDRASRQLLATQGEIKAINQRIEGLINELGDQVDTPLEQLQRQRDEVVEQLRIAKDESEQVESLSKSVDELVDRRDTLIRQIADSEKARDGSRAAETSTQAKLSAAEGEVPEEYRSLEALDAALEETLKHITALSERITDATKALEHAKSEHQRLGIELNSARNEAERDRENASTAEADFARRRLEQGFADDADYQSARLPQEQVDQLIGRINQYDSDVAIARNRVTTAETAAADLEQPDLEQLETALTTAEATRDSLFEQVTQGRSRCEHLRNAAKQLLDIARQKDEFDAQYQVAEYLSSVANGESTYSTYRVSFERFVLSAFLDEVLDYATHRLYNMTSGRYRLIRKTEGGDKRRSSGLDLEIEDSWTGNARDVSTLSGGEGFLAALAMALGLSEVVQNRAGGIRLQTLFVDEGFGSLDPDALDKSLTTLIDLQHGRLVGIISHVPELQERIDARLHVEAGKSGSRARFVL